MPVLLFCVGGCVAIPPDVRDLDASQPPIELSGTAFFPQARFQCGPAALATALSSSGIVVDVQDLIDSVYLPGRQGSLQLEMLAATRMAGRIPYVIDGRLRNLREELAAGRPIVVLQNLGIAAIPRWHYAVVVGIDTARDEVVLRSGVERRRITSIPTFLRTWRRGDYWGFVVLRPDESPANPDRQRYLAAIAGLEKAGRDKEAAVAWHVALRLWPNEPVALFGLGNARLAAGDDAAAEGYFRAVIELDTKAAAARNNLAIALARQARFAEATREIAIALGSSNDPALEKELLDTQALIADLMRSQEARDPATRQE